MIAVGITFLPDFRIIIEMPLLNFPSSPLSLLVPSGKKIIDLPSSSFFTTSFKVP